MPLLLLCVVLQALSFSQGLNGTDDLSSKSVAKHADHPDIQIELSTLSLSKGCSGVLRAPHQNTTVHVTLNLLDAEKKKELALQICELVGCGHSLEIGTTATVHNGTCLANCILKDSNLHNCTTAAEGDCTNATEVICEAVRLTGGRDRCAGRVELSHFGQWGTVCNEDFKIISGQVICAQLKCGSAVRVAHFGVGSGVIHISKMRCNGTESNLWECDPIDNTGNYCGHKEDAGIVCSESVEITPTGSTTELALTTLVAVAVTERSSGVSAAAIACIILSIVLLMFIIINAAVCIHFQRAKACVIHQDHSNSHRSLEDQSNVQIGVYNTQIVSAVRGEQYESLGPRMSSNYGRKFQNQATHNSDTDSDYEHQNSIRPQRLHLNNSPRDMNDVDSSWRGERYTHDVEINMDAVKSVDVNDSSSTSSGEFYQNTQTEEDNILKSRAETPSLHEKSPLTHLSYGDHNSPGTECNADVNDSSSTSSGEFYQNTEADRDNNFKSREDVASMHENSQYAPLSYGDTVLLADTDSQAVDVNDSDSTSSFECYQNTETYMDKNLHCAKNLRDLSSAEDEESPSLLEKSLQTPHSTQMTGNTAGYSGCRVPRAHSRDENDSDSTSSEECYQNIEIKENACLSYGEESPSFPEMSFQNPPIAQTTESTDGYDEQHVTTNFSQETDNSSTTSEASYVNVPSLKEEDNSVASSDGDYAEIENW
ncbi:T-cell differentiation antigen CD6-like isoform X3 [Pimephales promelas]|uniref:T-cell differentiation antigen CD6-like isoform X3 n=1 Tax=Pimephales promelas TaxID=90988 RepID=UPI0019555B0D|nr:T-cell differentiation antigen CD6-like isoform X3 [Pimephales promelas]